MKTNAFFSIIFFGFAIPDLIYALQTPSEWFPWLLLVMTLILMWTFLTIEDDQYRTVIGEIKRIRLRRKLRRIAAKQRKQRAYTFQKCC